jgi:DNA (cytosine-5)-methyltransferase 1
MTPTVGSLFAGVGGFDLGFERAGYRCAWQVEIDPWCQRVLAHHWPDVPKFGDVTDMSGAELAPVDVITFGSPCQDLSVAGRRAGLDGGRSGLFYEATRIIDEMRKATGGRYPTWAVWENVPGAFSSNNGNDFAAVLDALAECGALELEWRVLDARHFGVPQRRRRIFLVARFHPRTDSGSPIFPVGESGSGRTEAGGEAGQEVAGTLGGGAGSRGWAPDTDRMTFVPVGWQPARDVTSCLRAASMNVDDNTAKDGHLVFRASQYGDYEEGVGPLMARDAKAGKSGLVVGFQPNAVAVAENRDGGAGMEMVATYAPDVAGTLGTPRGGGRTTELDGHGAHVERDVAPTLNAFDNTSAGRSTVLSTVPHWSAPELAVRRLTPRECERLMGWPDDHTMYAADGSVIADSHRYRMCGNGVVANVSEYVARRLLAAGGDGTLTPAASATDNHMLPVPVATVDGTGDTVALPLPTTGADGILQLGDGIDGHAVTFEENGQRLLADPQGGGDLGAAHA